MYLELLKEKIVITASRSPFFYEPGFTYMIIGITLSDYKISQRNAFCNMENCTKYTNPFRAKHIKHHIWNEITLTWPAGCDIINLLGMANGSKKRPFFRKWSLSSLLFI